jgi:hypothetical protein
MTRFACKLGLALVAVLGVIAFTAAPADAHPHDRIIVERPRVVVPAYYPPAVYVAPAPVLRPVYPAYPVYPVAPVYAPAPVIGAGIRVGPLGIGIGIR